MIDIVNKGSFDWVNLIVCELYVLNLFTFCIVSSRHSDIIFRVLMSFSKFSMIFSYS